MTQRVITLPLLGLVAGTRAALGAGVGLLLADRLSAEQRRAVGWTLLLFGALSTVPLALEVLGGSRMSPSAGRPGRAARGAPARIPRPPHQRGLGGPRRPPPTCRSGGSFPAAPSRPPPPARGGHGAPRRATRPRGAACG